MSLTLIKHSFGEPAVFYIMVGMETHIPGFMEIPENCPYRLQDFFKFALAISIHTQTQYSSALKLLEKTYGNKAKKHYYLHVIELDQRFETFFKDRSLDNGDLTEIFIAMLKFESKDKGSIVPNTLIAKLLLFQLECYADIKVFNCSIFRAGRPAPPKDVFVAIPPNVSDYDINLSLMVCSDYSVFQETYKGTPDCESFLDVFSEHSLYRALPFSMRKASLKILRQWVPNHLDTIMKQHSHTEKLMAIYFIGCFLDDYLANEVNKTNFIRCCKEILPSGWARAIQALIDQLSNSDSAFCMIPHRAKIIIVSNAINYLYDDFFTSLDPKVQRFYLAWSIAYPKKLPFVDFLKKDLKNELEDLFQGWLTKKTPYKCLPFEYRIKQYPKFIIRLASLDIDDQNHIEFRSKIFGNALTLINLALSNNPRCIKEFNAALIELLTYLFLHCKDETFVARVIKYVIDDNADTPTLISQPKASEDLDLHHYELADLDHGFKIFVTPGVKKNCTVYSLENLESFWERNKCHLIFAVGIPDDFSIYDIKPDFPPYFLTNNGQCVARSNNSDEAIRVYEICLKTTKRYVCHIPRQDRPPLDLSEEDLLFIRGLICYFNFNDEFKTSNNQIAIATHCMAGLNRSPTLSAIIANMIKQVRTKTEVSPDSAIDYVRTISRTTNRLQKSRHDHSYNTIIHKLYEGSVISAIHTLNTLFRSNKITSFFERSSKGPFIPACIPDEFDFRYGLLHRISNDTAIFTQQYSIIFELFDECTFENPYGFISLLEEFLSGTEYPNMTATQRCIQSCLRVKTIIHKIRGCDTLSGLETLKAEYEQLRTNIFSLNDPTPLLPIEAKGVNLF